MDEFKIFENEEFGQVRIVEYNGKTYVVGNDIATALEYSRPYEAVTEHCRRSEKYTIITKAGPQKIKIIPESDVLLLIQKAQKSTIHKKEQFIKWLIKFGIVSGGIVLETRIELDFTEKLMKTLEPFGITIELQKRIGRYRADIYIKEINTVIEFDENGHKHYNVHKEISRQNFIRKTLNCKIIRVSSLKSDYWNIGYVFKQIGGLLK
jgi:very-short-patch-repair endonuclease